MCDGSGDLQTMKAVMLAVTLVAMSSPACAVITQGQALQEVARCTYASSRRDGHYVTYSHALYLAREVKDFSRGLALSGFMTYYPAGTSLKEGSPQNSEFKAR